MVRLEVLPAAHGDALLLEWGTKRSPHRMLIDAGPLGTYRGVHDRLAALGRSPEFETLVVTHIDGDHIEGVVRLLQDRDAMKLRFGDVWFNGWPQLSAVSDTQGADQGEMVGAMIQRDELPWNTPFTEGPVMVSPEGEDLPVIPLPGDATVTILGPGPAQLRKLRKDWIKVLKEVHVRPGHVDAALKRLAKRRDLSGIEDVQGGPAALDSSTANGSSISFLFEQGRSSLLLTGDSHGGVLAEGLRRLAAERGVDRVPVDVFKLPHHGSRGNVTTEMLELVETSNYVLSTSGARYHHPDKEAMIRVLSQEHRETPTLWFNHDTETTRPWDAKKTKEKYGYVAVYPDDAAAGVVLEV